MSRVERIGAAQAAAELLVELDIDQNHPVDPFALIDDLGLTLSITKLDNLLGAFVPEGVGGVLITSERPANVQRYTAAHEIGHWRLHRRYMADTASEIFGGAPTELEYEAQIFASYLLMPEPLFQDAVSRYELRKGSVSAEQIYLVSRDLFVSYEAAARRLQTSRYIAAGEVASFVAQGRLRALATAFNGLRPRDGHAEMWAVGLELDEEPARLVVGERDEVVVTLPEHRLSGWRWLSDDQLEARRGRPTSRERPTPSHLPAVATPATTSKSWSSSSKRTAADVRAALDLIPQDESRKHELASDGDGSASVEVVADLYDSSGRAAGPREIRRVRTERAGVRGITPSADDQGRALGGAGIRRVVLRCDAPGQWSVSLHYAHAYDASIDPILDFVLDLRIQPSPTHAFRARLLDSDLDVRFVGDPDDEASFLVEVP